MQACSNDSQLNTDCWGDLLKNQTNIKYQLFSCSFLVATTGPSVYYNQSPAYNSQYLLRTAATNVTPTKVRTYLST